ncbi:proteinase inhibitor I4 serpin [Trichosporon asahii var. asahii CBS 8904]|uniref:Proteinase inhibitor I4 serpin n=1 Tax=Trichosporon asahii var. asahii (strain CBS 8904) TaxID=1220162 RepID=K1VT58_TRIAC|nr:proteinase inhibitor I4 serpin [Trichosporon asahii var. asahii CBS 8904]
MTADLQPELAPMDTVLPFAPELPFPPKQKKPADPLTKAINDLAERWMATLPDAPTVFSPAGVWPLLAILADAATGAVADDLKEALCYHPTDGTGALKAAIKVLDWLRETPGLNGAIGVWIRRTLSVKKEWLDRVPATSRGILHGAGDKAKLDIWTRENTDGLIDEFPCEAENLGQFILASTIVLQTTWLDMFEPEGQSQLVRTTQGLDIVRSNGQVTVVRIEGKAGEYSSKPKHDVYLVLGIKGEPPSTVLGKGLSLIRHTPKKTTYEQAKRLSGPGISVRQVERHEPPDDGRPFVTVYTHAFEVTGEHELVGNAVFGLQRAVEPGSHFPCIADGELGIDGGSQVAVARFTESGFSAAAVSDPCWFGSFADPNGRATCIDVKFKRAFGFLAMDRKTGVVTFGGWVTNKNLIRD